MGFLAGFPQYGFFHNVESDTNDFMWPHKGPDSDLHMSVSKCRGGRLGLRVAFRS